MNESLSKSQSSSSLYHYWESHVINWESSNLTQTEYCQRHKLKYNRFWYWKNKLSSRSKRPASFQFVEVSQDLLLNQSGSHQDESSDFQSPRRESGHYNLRLWLDGTHCIDIGDNFSSDVLKRLVECLGSL